MLCGGPVKCHLSTMKAKMLEYTFGHEGLPLFIIEEGHMTDDTLAYGVRAELDCTSYYVRID